MYLFDKTISYDFYYTIPEIIIVGTVTYNGNVTHYITGIVYNDKSEQLGIFQYEDYTFKILKGDLDQKVLEKLLEELDNININ